MWRRTLQTSSSPASMFYPVRTGEDRRGWAPYQLIFFFFEKHSTNELISIMAVFPFYCLEGKEPRLVIRWWINGTGARIVEPEHKWTFLFLLNQMIAYTMRQLDKTTLVMYESNYHIQQNS
jgi:hypothetical protein